MLVLSDGCTGYQWLYCLKTKDEVLQVMKKWYSDIAELLDKHKLFVVMQDNSGANTSCEICEFLNSNSQKVRLAAAGCLQPPWLWNLHLRARPVTVG